MEKERSRRSGATSRGPPPVVVIAEPDAGPASGPLLEDYSGDVCVGRVGLLWHPGAGRVQICHKGTPGRDRPRRKARNINVSSRALRLDRGLCGRFGQFAATDRPGRAVTRRATGPAPAWTMPPTPPSQREHRSGKDPATRTGPRGPRPSPGPAGMPPIFRERVVF